MRGRVLVIGRGLLGQAVARNPGAKDFKFVPHDAVTTSAALDGFDCVINLALDPGYRDQPYRPEMDVDRRLASLIGDRRLHYIMASTRKVYGHGGDFPFKEESPLKPVDNYGRNKAQTEALLSEMLGDRLTVMRISNVVGFDWQWDRAIFIGILLDSLRRNKRIVFDVSPFARRDFITDDAVAAALIWAAGQRLSGTFNLGSGIALPIGHLALWILEAYGSGDLLITSPYIRDEFLLDVEKLSRDIGPPCTIEMIKDKCTELGRQIAHA